MQEDFRALLMTAHVGAVAWGRRPQGAALPATVLTTASEVTDYTYAGSVDLVTTRVQADIFAATLAEANAIDRAIVGLVSGYAGTVGSTEFLGIFLESRFDGTEEAADGAVVARISRDLMVKHKET